MVGFDTTLSYARLCRAAWWIKQGKPYFATNPDRVCPTDEPTVLVDCGSICAALREATGRAPAAVLGKPSPAMLRGIYGDPDRFVKQYWSQIPGRYFTGDGAKQDKDGYFWLLGRIDDVMNISGHRVSTMEVESALVEHESVAEAAVIGRTHEIKGQAIAAFVTLKHGQRMTPTLQDDIKAHVVKKIGALARPDDVIYAAELPKTRSGKIMRRVLKAVILDRDPGDITTIEDEGSVEEARQAWIQLRAEARSG